MKPILQVENIMLHVPVMEKKEAIHLAASLLEEKGYVDKEYYDMMLEKETECETYIGNGVAIPHGISHSEHAIHHSGIVLLQFKKPILYNGHDVYVVIGIAGKYDEHIEILSNIACTLQDMENVWKIVRSDSQEEIYQMLSFMNEKE